MISGRPTLVEFEAARLAEEWVPPKGSNSFYDIGDGRINLLTIRDHPENYRFQLFTDAGTVRVGDGTFYISGNAFDVTRPYETMTVIQDTTLVVDGRLEITKGRLDVHGVLELRQNASLILGKDAVVILYPDSTLIIPDQVTFQTTGNASMSIYGHVNVHLNRVDTVLDARGVTVDTAAVLNVTGIDLKNRPTSLTDYEGILRDQVINEYTQGETHTSIGRMGYTWRSGTPVSRSQVIRLSVLNGTGVLGDFKLSVLGMPERTISDLQVVAELLIRSGTTLYISETYEESHFIRPELYIGRIISNTDVPGKCIVQGNLIVDGTSSKITLDRGGSLYIEEHATVELRNGATIQSTYNESDRVLFIHGTLVIDTIDQISTFDAENIYFGSYGKLVIRNPDPGRQITLFKVPNGIKHSDLYRMFAGRFDHLEYHISNNTGIEIDAYMKYYSRELKDWFGGYRIEKAIKEGYLVWHKGGFIRLNQEIIPWASPSASVLDACQLFKSSAAEPQDRLQDVVNRLQYAGCEGITFVFLHGKTRHTAELQLSPVHMISAYNYPLTNTYSLTTDGDGEIFLRNNVTTPSAANIIHPASLMFPIIDEGAMIDLDGK